MSEPNVATSFAGNVEVLSGRGKTDERDLGKIDILVNNAAEQHPQETITMITEKQLERPFAPTFSRCFS